MSQQQFFKPVEFGTITLRERSIADGIFKNLKEKGLKELTILKFDLSFESNNQNKLGRLSKFLSDTYHYQMNPTKAGYMTSVVEGVTGEVFIDYDSLMVWVTDMVRVGREYDCKFGDWGCLVDPNNCKLFDFKSTNAKDWFLKGVKEFDGGNLSMAFQYFKAASLNDPKYADTFDGLGTVMLDLFMFKGALDYYDKAIRLAPEEYSFYLNRGAVKDYLGDYQGAIIDYDLVISKYPNNPKIYFNRGNTKLNMKDLKGAREDWQKAKELGADYAEERIKQFHNL